VKQLCEVFGVHRSSYRYWVNRNKALASERVLIRAEVRQAHEISNGSPGARTIADIVTTKGIPLSRYRVSKFMKELELVSCQNIRTEKHSRSRLLYLTILIVSSR
jgi:putative transposase